MTVYKPLRIRRYMAAGLHGDGSQRRKMFKSVFTAPRGRTLAHFFTFDILTLIRSAFPMKVERKPPKIYKVLKPQVQAAARSELPRRTQ